MDNLNWKQPIGVVALCFVSLLGMRDTGIFITDHTTTLNSGNKLSFEVEERANIIEEKENGYLVQKGEAKVTVPKNKIKLLGDNSRSEYVVKNNTALKSNGQVIRNLFLGETVSLVEDYGEECLITTSDGVTGTVTKSTLECLSEPVEMPSNENISDNQGAALNIPNTDNQKANRVLSSAANKIGATYVYGATGDGGYDCSGLVYAIYKNELGINLPRTSREQSQYGSQISKSQLQSGDLVFFNTSGNGVSHVGIYIGNDNFIHASTGKGEVVQSSLNDNYYENTYVNATRVL